MPMPSRMRLVMSIGILQCLFLLRLSEASANENKTQSAYPEVPAEAGELCTVCGASLSENDVALIVKGRRVPLDRTMVNEFLQNKDKYFAKMQARGALFSESVDAPAGTSQGGITWGWFLAGMYVLVALIFGGMSGYIAVGKGLRPIPAFFIGFFLSAFGFLYVVSQPRAVEEGKIPAGFVKVPVTSAPVTCSKCAYANHPSASKCAGCGSALEPIVESEVARVV